MGIYQIAMCAGKTAGDLRSAAAGPCCIPRRVMTPAPIQRIGLVGFGEVGGIFGRDFAKQGIAVSVYDILFHSPEARAAMHQRAHDCGVEARESLAECLRDRELIISAVTAS